MLRLVNTAPGKDPSPTKPGGPYHFGLRTTTGNIPLGTVEAFVGSTDLRLHGLLPDLDPMLQQATLQASLRSAQRRQPEGAPISTSISQGRMVLSRSDGNPLSRCVYEMRVAIDTNASLLGYLRVRKKTWALTKPDWCWLNGIAGLYFGLVHGQYNTGCYTFLQDANKLVIAGALTAFQQARHLQQILDLPWQSLATDESIEIWISFNNAGFPLPMIPPNVPTVDVWVATPSFGPVRLGRYPASVFGQLPGGVQEQYATLFVGNAGQAGDVVEVEDWALFTDFRTAMLAGNPVTDTSVLIRPDSPITYRSSSDLVTPQDLKVSRWFLSNDPGSLTPIISYGFQPGRRGVPLSVVLTKPSGVGHVAFERDEPRLMGSPEGFMLEAFLAGQNFTLDHSTTGIGMEVDDGVNLYSLVMIENILDRTFGIALVGATSALSGYKSLTPLDFTSLKHVKLIFDRPRRLLLVYFDDVKVGEFLVGTDVILRSSPSGSQGKVRLGHLLDSDTHGDFVLSMVNFQNRYLAYEASDSQLPQDTATPFTFEVSGAGTALMGTSPADVQEALLISKTDNGTPFSKASFFRSYDFGESKGAFVEMRVRVPFYVDLYGTPLSKNSSTGVGVKLHMGFNYLQLGFYDAGVHGRMFGVQLGPNGKSDIINQTEAGKKLSVQVDWTEWQTYRIHYKAYDSIQVWVGSVVSDPTIVIPWSGQFPLISQPIARNGVEFGHLSADEGSSSEWHFLRWGASSGYDVSIEQLFPKGAKDYQFGGKSMYQLDFDGDQPDPGLVVMNDNSRVTDSFGNPITAG